MNGISGVYVDDIIRMASCHSDDENDSDDIVNMNSANSAKCGFQGGLQCHGGPLMAFDCTPPTRSGGTFLGTTKVNTLGSTQWPQLEPPWHWLCCQTGSDRGRDTNYVTLIVGASSLKNHIFKNQKHDQCCHGKGCSLGKEFLGLL